MYWNKRISTSITLTLVTILLILTGCKKKGCTDPTAINYDPAAEKPGFCEYATNNTIIIDCANSGTYSDHTLINVPDNEIDYHITCDMYFYGTVTIDPGVNIYVDEGVEIVFVGNVHMNGTTSEPIHFKPYSSTWEGIRFWGSEGDAIMNNVIIEGTYSTSPGNLSHNENLFAIHFESWGSNSLAINNVTIQDCAQGGIFFEGISPYDPDVTIDSLKIYNTDTPIRTSHYSLLDCINSIDCSNNINNVIYMSLGSMPPIDDNIHIPKTTIPVYWSTLNLGNPNFYPSSVTIDAGANLLMGDDLYIDCDSSFICNGTLTDPIIFQAANTSWEGFKVNCANGTISFDYCQFDGSHTSQTITAGGFGNFVFTNSNINTNYTCGITFYSGPNPILTNSTITGGTNLVCP